MTHVLRYPSTISSIVALLTVMSLIHLSTCNNDAKRLYETLLSGHTSLVRPVSNNSERLTIKLALKLAQLIDVVSTPI